MLVSSLTAFVSACVRARASTCLLGCLLACLPVYLSACLPSLPRFGLPCLLACMPACLPRNACVLACVRVCVCACVRACEGACGRGCTSAFVHVAGWPVVGRASTVTHSCNLVLGQRATWSCWMCCKLKLTNSRHEVWDAWL